MSRIRRRLTRGALVGLTAAGGFAFASPQAGHARDIGGCSGFSPVSSTYICHGRRYGTGGQETRLWVSAANSDLDNTYPRTKTIAVGVGYDCRNGGRDESITVDAGVGNTGVGGPVELPRAPTCPVRP